MIRTLVAVFVSATLAFSAPAYARGGYGHISKSHIVRSTAAKNAFKKANPCPADGATSGSCPGYVIDHVKPLACGGADGPSNMQWQTVTVGKAKDRVERKGC